MDRLLLLMPRFMDYEKSLKENLNRKYEVCWLDSDEFDREILDKFYKCNKIRWGLDIYLESILIMTWRRQKRFS